MKRKTNTIQSRDKFYIFTNGKKSEYNYFTLLMSKRSIYDVKIKFENKDCLGLVKEASKIHSANQVWCVFDTDLCSEDKLKEVISLANNSNIYIAYSNIAFEVWLINHYEDCPKSITNVKDYEKIINRILKEKNIKVSYEKNDMDLLRKHFIPLYLNAIQNSKVIHQFYLKENKGNKELFYKYVSSTNVYQLIEALKLADK